MEGDGAAGVAPDRGAAPETGAAEASKVPAFRPWRDGALIAAGWVVLAAFVFVPGVQILGLVLVPLIATLLVRGGSNA